MQTLIILILADANGLKIPGYVWALWAIGFAFGLALQHVLQKALAKK